MTKFLLFELQNSTIIICWSLNGILFKLFFELNFLVSFYLSSTNGAYVIVFKPFLKAFCVEEVILIMRKRSNVASTFFEALHADAAFGNSILVKLQAKLSMNKSINNRISYINSLMRLLSTTHTLKLYWA